MGIADERVATVDRPEALQALAHPVRVRILEALRTAASAAAVARRVGQPRQNVNYHVKELERAGLVRRVGRRPSGNFTETLYQARAGTFLVSPRASWGDPRRLEVLAEQLSLGHLVDLGEELQRDASALLDQAAFDGDEIPSAAVRAELRFESARDRTMFMREYLVCVGPLFEKYGRKRGAPYKVAIAVYPEPPRSREET